MTDSSDRWHDFDLLLGRVVDDIQSDEDVRRLNEILRADAEACQRYLTCVHLHGRLAWGRGVRIDGKHGAIVVMGRRAECEGTNPELAMMNGEPPATMMSSRTVPPIHHSEFISHHFQLLSGVLSAYAAATLILGASLLVGWTWDKASSRQIAMKASRPPTVLAGVEAQTPSIGWVGSMANCQWVDPNTAPKPGEPIQLGRRFAFSSGVLEIHYRSRAGVVLQGPVTYEVDSPSGGFLSAGKLAVSVGQDAVVMNPALERAAGIRPPPSGLDNALAAGVQGANVMDQRADSASRGSLPTIGPTSFVPPPSSFAIRTPTAVVFALRDNDAEFGVELDRKGVSRTHVFQGEVKLGVIGSEKSSFRLIPLEKGQLARVGVTNGRRIVAITSGMARPGIFARREPRPLRVLSSAEVCVGELATAPRRPLTEAGTDTDLDSRPIFTAAWAPDGDAHGSVDGAQHSASPGTAAVVTRTRSVTFEVAGLPPATVVIRGRFVAYNNYVTAMRLNGKTQQGPKHVATNQPCETGGILLLRGFVKGINTLEIDMSQTQSPVLAERGFRLFLELSGIPFPPSEDPADADGRGDGHETTIEIR